jgi:hypothetical protein
MSNDYFNLTSVVTRLTKARAAAVNTLAAAITAAFDKLPASALIASDRVTYAAATGTGNAIQLSLPLVTAYTEGMSVRFKVAATNSGATTLQINALGARAIRRAGDTNLNAGDLLAGSMHEVAFNGTTFELLTAVQSDVNEAALAANAASASALVASNAASDASTSAAAAATSASNAAGAVAAAIGNTVQAFSAILQGIAGQVYNNDQAPIRISGAWSKFTVTAFGRSVVAAADSPAALAVLGALPLLRSSAGVGQILPLDAGNGASLSLPGSAPQRYAFWVVPQTVSGGALGTSSVGVANGGTLVSAGGAGVILRGFCIRVE